MQKTSKLPKYVRNAVALFAVNCPMCGSEAQDRRYKNRTMSSFTLTNRRFTNRTMTRECRVCGLRFSFTWKTFVNALKKKAKLERNPMAQKILLDRADCVKHYFL